MNLPTDQSVEDDYVPPAQTTGGPGSIHQAMKDTSTDDTAILSEHDSLQFHDFQPLLLPPTSASSSTPFKRPTRTPAIVTQPVNTSVPEDYMVWSIITMCCPLPFGIMALSASCESRRKARRGDIEGAKITAGYALGLNILQTFLAGAGLYILLLEYSNVNLTIQ
ncbi:uncharacterized protein LOC117337625 isoform X3 [Pecten maximus]|uniref:uncharacterized protein LOC117337625 isoform X3 n=1 Tax=Pecten maximus TaxID=6579 RepID=UPI0014581289|nr:uncharacterized protein LOC117337625 isoform X3 [Pecten maximus]